MSYISMQLLKEKSFQRNCQEYAAETHRGKVLQRYFRKLIKICDFSGFGGACETCQVLEICIEVCFILNRSSFCTKKKERKKKIYTIWYFKPVFRNSGDNCMHESCMRISLSFSFLLLASSTSCLACYLFSLHNTPRGSWAELVRKTTWGNGRAAPAAFLLLPGWCLLLLLQGGCLCILTMNLSTTVKLWAGCLGSRG